MAVLHAFLARSRVPPAPFFSLQSLKNTLAGGLHPIFNDGFHPFLGMQVAVLRLFAARRSERGPLGASAVCALLVAQVHHSTPSVLRAPFPPRSTADAVFGVLGAALKHASFVGQVYHALGRVLATVDPL